MKIGEFLNRYEAKTEETQSIKMRTIKTIEFIAQHHLPISAYEKILPFLKETFPELDEVIDKIPKTETSVRHILHQTIRPVIEEDIAGICQKNFFSLAIDESTDITNKSQLW